MFEESSRQLELMFHGKRYDERRYQGVLQQLAQFRLRQIGVVTGRQAQQPLLLTNGQIRPAAPEKKSLLGVAFG